LNLKPQQLIRSIKRLGL